MELKADSRFGLVDSFTVKPYLELAEMLCEADEVESALKVLDLLPGVHRDYIPEEISNLKAEITSRIFTTIDYMDNDGDCNVDHEKAVSHCNNMVRGKLMVDSVKAYNEQGKAPHIVDVGPGDYWLPMGLAKMGLKFTYEPLKLHEKAYKMAFDHIYKHVAKGISIGQPYIFSALEVIEHMLDTKELLIQATKYGSGRPDEIHISTPCYTYDGRKKDWRKDRLPHLRTYTPRELIQTSSSLFPGYDWKLYMSQPLSIVGKRY